MNVPIPKIPYIKGKNFLFNPVVKYGIPDYADSIKNPKVIGTPKWEAYWNEQLYYIKNGYQTGGIYLPGRYYYYANFNSMSTVTGIISPDMTDLHLEMCYLIDYVKANGLNFICAKKRRAGISEFFQKAVVDYDWRFTNGACQVGIAAGQDSYAQDFMRKWRSGDALMPPELRTKRLKDNDNEVIAGYKYKTQSGEMVDEGTKNTMYVRTMFKNPALFKGLFLNTVVAEECGEFENLEKFFSHTRPCVMDGSKQIGNMYFYGTGGNMNKGSRDFKKMWDEADRNNFVKFLIPAKRFHKPFYGGCTSFGQEVGKTPELLKLYKPYQLVGVEDMIAAEANIIKERQDLLATKNMEKYQEHLKDYPMTEQDVFRKTVINVFETETMQDQADAISSNPKKYVTGNLEWKKDAKNEIILPLQVEYKLDATISEDGDCILFHVDHLTPIRTHSNLYCAGGDSYDQNKAKTSKSKGAMCVLIRKNTIEGKASMMPVATICCRPNHKETFYEMCLKLAIFYFCDDKGHITTPNAFLIDVANKLIFKYFEERGYANLLAYRPRKFESEHSEQTHIYGAHLNNHSKPLMVGLMQSFVDYYCKGVWFPELINQLQNYDEVEIGSDNDLADALGLALMQDASDDNQSRDLKDWDNPDAFNLTQWKTDASGNKIPILAKLDPTTIISPGYDNPSRFITLD